MKRIIASIVLSLVSLNGVAQTSAINGCKVGKDAPAFWFWTWPANSKIKVYILNADFIEADLPFLLKPFQNWNDVVSATGSGVKFEYVGSTTAPLYCQNCLTIMRGKVFDKVKRHATELRTYSARRDQIMTWAHIVSCHDNSTFSFSSVVDT